MQSPYPSEFQKKTLWRALTGLGIFTLGFLLVSLIWLISQVLGYLQPVLIPIAVSGIIAYLLDPFVSWLQKKGLSRLKSVITVFTSFIVAIVVMGLIIVPPIVSQAKDLFTARGSNGESKLGQSITKTITELGETSWIKPSAEWALARHESNQTPQTTQLPTSQEPKVPFSETNLAYQITSHTEEISNYASKFITAGTSTILASLGLVVGLAMVPIYLYYFLKESAAIKAHWHEYVPLRASSFKNEVVATLQEINGYLISFFRGQMLVAFIDGILVGIALFIFGLPYALVIGVAMAVLGVIPYIGNILCLIPSCIIAYVHYNVADNREGLEWMLGSNPWAYVVAVIAIFLIVQQINSLATAPKIVGDSVGLHPMTVIFSMLFWSLLLGGFLGAILAVPMTAAVKVLFRRYIWEARIKDNATKLVESVEASH
ncbi:AI-2E family transporter [Rubritalea tangerina]|uniref:AI-2E family transporter n=1 Tax=Rubritalea tangerina TaxID=430798 RepID=A0ABW4ZE78_9BACT